MSLPISRAELVALVALMFASIAFSVDSMLPALPEIGQDLSPDAPNRAALVLTSFMLGLGMGTFITGPLSDAIGRRPVILGGALLFILAAGLAWIGASLEMVVLARLLQGLAASGPRIAALAVLRDCFKGRAMAQVLSFVMIVFTIVPAMAPLLGTFIVAIGTWHTIFAALGTFMAIISVWVLLRLPETLAPENRRPLRFKGLSEALVELATHPTVRISILVQALSLGVLFSLITQIHPIYDQVFDQAASFPYWFCAIALLSGTGSLLNAKLVIKVGMRQLVTWAYLVQIVISSAVIGLENLPLSENAAFGVFVFWQTSLFFMIGLTLGNLNAIAMEPMGHIAGMAASIVAGVSTVLASLAATLIGLSFNGSIFPLGLGVLTMSLLAFGLMRFMARAEIRLAHT